jgi:hypothetical protein
MNIMNNTKRVIKWHGQMELSCVSPNQNRTPIFGAKKNFGPKRGGKQGELVGTHTCFKCILKG